MSPTEVSDPEQPEGQEILEVRNFRDALIERTQNEGTYVNRSMKKLLTVVAETNVHALIEKAWGLIKWHATHPGATRPSRRPLE